MCTFKVTIKVGWAELASICAFSAFIIYKTRTLNAREPTSDENFEDEKTGDGSSGAKTLSPRADVGKIENAASSDVSKNEGRYQVGSSEFEEDFAKSNNEDKELSKGNQIYKGKATDVDPEKLNEKVSFADFEHEIENPERDLNDKVEVHEQNCENSKNALKQEIGTPNEVLRQDSTNIKGTFEHDIKNPKKTLEQEIKVPKETLKQEVKKSEEALKKDIKTPKMTFLQNIEKLKKSLQQKIEIPKEIPKQEIKNPKKPLQKKIEIPKGTFEQKVENQKKAFKQEIENPKMNPKQEVGKPKKPLQNKFKIPKEIPKQEVVNREKDHEKSDIKANENYRPKRSPRGVKKERDGCLPRNKKKRNYKNNQKGMKRGESLSIQERSKKQSNFFEHYESCFDIICKGLEKVELNLLQSFSKWHSDAKNELNKQIPCLVKNRNEKLCRKCNCTLKCNYTQFIFDFRSVLRNSRFLTSSSEEVYKILNEDENFDVVALFNDLRNVCKHLKSGFYNFGKGPMSNFKTGPIGMN